MSTIRVAALHARSLLVALSLLGVPAALAQRNSTPFTREVEKHFDDWDRNRNGTLEASELDVLVIDNDLKGAPAAAVAALKSAQRSGKFELPALTRDYFHDYETQVAAGKKPSPAFDQSFSRGVRRITK